jgi:hypothetical protein
MTAALTAELGRTAHGVSLLVTQVIENPDAMANDSTLVPAVAMD